MIDKNLSHDAIVLNDEKYGHLDKDPNSNITYQLSLNTWYNFTLTGGFMSNINNLYINGIYTYQFNNNTIINTYLFNSSNDYITATGNSQNIIGWTRLLTYNEIYTLYNNTEKYIPSINESIYSNIAFIFDLTNINTNTVRRAKSLNQYFINQKLILSGYDINKDEKNTFISNSLIVSFNSMWCNRRKSDKFKRFRFCSES